MESELTGLGTPILAPVSVADFYERYWEIQPLHISRVSNQHLADVISAEQMLERIEDQQLYFPDVQLTQATHRLSPDDYTDDNRKINPRRARHLYEQGATLVWSRAHDWFNGVRGLCRNLQSTLGLPCLANAYLSPAARQGFNAHYDSHDVFIVQVSGSKTFRFYANGLTLPFNYERFDAEVHRAGELSEEITLNAGDTLYIPRGMMHDAVACGDQASLHITVGVYTLTNKDLLQKSIELLADQQLELRRSIPGLQGKGLFSMTAVDEQFSLEKIRTVSAQAFSLLQDELALDAISSQLPGNVVSLNENDVADSTGLAVVSHNVMNCVREVERVKLRLFSKVLEYNDPMGAALEWMLSLNGAVFYCKSVPLDTGEQRVALCKQLLTDDVLRLKG